MSNIIPIIEDKIVHNTYFLLQKHKDGLTITELVEKSTLSRSAVRTALAKLEGAEKISLRKIGMAKVFTVRKGK